MSKATYLHDGPRVLSLYEGFFAGGARILHTAVIGALHSTSPQHHRVLSLTNRVQREFTSQSIEDDTCYRRLVSAGVPVTALRRTADEPVRPADRMTIRREIDAADVLLSLKEQPLQALSRIGTRGTPLITALHRSDPEHQGPGLGELVRIYEEGMLAAAICCATSTQRAYHEATGIPLDLLPVVPNGVDLRRFRPDPRLRREVRDSMRAPEGAPVVLIAARFDAMKDIPLFVRSAALFVREHPDAHLVMCGAGMTLETPALRDQLAAELPHWDAAATNVHALGIQSSMAALYNAADLVVLTSAFGEAAPLCLLEGMAAGAVPVSTDVGDTRAMLGDDRLIAERQPAALAEAWKAAYAQREEHSERILRHRQRLSDQRGIDAYLRIVDAAVRPTRAEVAV
jgi:glycosyltransferase involved in cell wall biosynthesis